MQCQQKSAVLAALTASRNRSVPLRSHRIGLHLFPAALSHISDQLLSMSTIRCFQPTTSLVPYIRSRRCQTLLVALPTAPHCNRIVRTDSSDCRAGKRSYSGFQPRTCCSSLVSKPRPFIFPYYVVCINVMRLPATCRSLQRRVCFLISLLSCEENFL